MIVTKDAILDAIAIGRIVVDEDLEHKFITMKSSRDHSKYVDKVKPALKVYKNKHGKTPQLILNDLLKSYTQEHEMEELFESMGLHFYGNVVNSYTWASITQKDPKIKLNKFSYYPQLYVLVNSVGVKFGFCYGNYVKADDKRVNIVKSNESIQSEIIKLLASDENLKLYSDCEAFELPRRENELQVKNIQQLAEKWTNDSHIIGYFPLGNIPDNIEQQVIEAFNRLLPIFQSICMLSDVMQTIIDIVVGPTWKTLKEELKCNFTESKLQIKGLHFESEQEQPLVKEIEVALKSGKHIILIGPPGTGKSKLAELVCDAYREKGNHLFTTATSDWSTYDTIGCYRPRKDGLLEFSPGIFLRCLKDEKGAPSNKWLIIDEINRADIDKSFGPLFSVLAGADVALPFEIEGKQITVIGTPKDDMTLEKYDFVVHPDWRIIATMNTYDKSSLYEMSYAFMRRFAFISVDVPVNINKELIKSYTEIWKFKLDEQIYANVAELWQLINLYRKIGPAVIKDICTFLKNSDPPDYVSPLNMYVIPQFEGLLEVEAMDFIKKTLQLSYIKEGNRLKRSACDFLGIDVKKI